MVLWEVGRLLFSVTKRGRSVLCKERDLYSFGYLVDICLFWILASLACVIRRGRYNFWSILSELPYPEYIVISRGYIYCGIFLLMDFECRFCGLSLKLLLLVV